MNNNEQNTNNSDYIIPAINDNEIISAPETPGAPEIPSIPETPEAPSIPETPSAPEVMVQTNNVADNLTNQNVDNTFSQQSTIENNNQINDTIADDVKEPVDNTKYREITLSKNAPPTTLAEALMQTETKKPKVNSTVVILLILALCIFVFRERLSEFFSTFGQNNQVQVDDNNNSNNGVVVTPGDDLITPSDDLITPSDDNNLNPETVSE